MFYCYRRHRFCHKTLYSARYMYVVDSDVQLSIHRMHCWVSICNKDYTNAPPCYITRTLPVLLKQTCVITTEARVPFVARPYEILWWAKWNWGRQLSEYFCFSLAVPFRHCCLLVFIYPLLLPEGQADDSWEPSSTAVLYRQSVRWTEKCPHELQTTKTPVCPF